MKSIELTEKYLEIIFSGKNLESLENIFAPNLQFNGPWYQFQSAIEYITSLKKQPFTDTTYRIIKSYGDTDSACTIYRMTAHGLTDIPMVVHTTVSNGQISSILLIFDTGVFKK